MAHPSLQQQQQPPKPKKPRSDEIRFEDLTFYENIGEGNFGQVFRGSLWGQEVALKRLSFKASSTDDRRLKEFKKEVRIMRTLRHPNIVEFLGMCHNRPGNLVIVTEYLSGGSLETLMEKKEKAGKVLSTTRILALAKDVARGLNWLHHKGIIHRDLKTANILLDSVGKGKLADFGLSHVKRRQSNDGSYGVVGTPCYMAPEVLRKDKYGVKADVFSFAIVLVEMILGKYPYESEDSKSTRTFEDAIVGGFRPELPPCLPSMQRLLKACWQDNPEQRPGMDKVLAWLEEIEIEYQAEREHSLRLLEGQPEEVQHLFNEEKRRADENARLVRSLRADVQKQKGELISGRRVLRQTRGEIRSGKKRIQALERSLTAARKKIEILKRAMAVTAAGTANVVGGGASAGVVGGGVSEAAGGGNGGGGGSNRRSGGQRGGSRGSGNGGGGASSAAASKTRSQTRAAAAAAATGSRKRGYSGDRSSDTGRDGAGGDDGGGGAGPGAAASSSLSVTSPPPMRKKAKRGTKTAIAAAASAIAAATAAAASGNVKGVAGSSGAAAVLGNRSSGRGSGGRTNRGSGGRGGGGES